jgi:iron complex transport system substrate-binding protein
MQAGPTRGRKGPMRITHMGCITLVLTFVLVLYATGGAPAAYPLTVTDALGRTVTLAAPPQRIVSLAPNLTEMLFALGLDERIVGISDADDYPRDRLAGRARVGGVELNVEAIVGLHPDLIVGLSELQRGQLASLITLGLPVLALQARTLPDVYAQIALLGRLIDRDESARRVISAMRAREEHIASAVQGLRPPRVYVEIWGEPPIAAGSLTFIDDLIHRAGGVNILSDLPEWPQVADEVVIARDPEVILLTYPGRAQLMDRPAWGHVAAVRSHRVVEVPSALVSRPGPRVVLGLEILAHAIHPHASTP